jgi:hypothetical protein
MFGGDTNAAQPADQVVAQDNAMADAPSNGMTPGDAPMNGYDPAASYVPAPDPGVPAAASAVPPLPDIPEPAHENIVSPTVPAPAPTDSLSAVPAMPDDLANIKQQALQQLSPLVGHLDQTPEEKFRTTMMMIQAADNADLIKDAYAAAQQITDEKVRAQALLDVVNEINYFTQHHDQPQQ